MVRIPPGANCWSGSTHSFRSDLAVVPLLEKYSASTLMYVSNMHIVTTATTLPEKKSPIDPATSLDSLRRTALLDAAINVFARFGYRKTSMDEVARSARVSRPGLYLHFANKEELFKAAVLHALSDQLAAASAVLADTKKPLESRLVAALDEWLGRHVGAMGADASDLIETSGLFAKELSRRVEGRGIAVNSVHPGAVGGTSLQRAWDFT